MDIAMRALHPDASQCTYCFKAATVASYLGNDRVTIACEKHRGRAEQDAHDMLQELKRERQTVKGCPERFAGAPVIAAIKVMDDPSEHPYKYVIVTSNHPRLCAVHTIGHNGVEWVGGQGQYDLPWDRAIDLMAEKAKEARHE